MSVLGKVEKKMQRVSMKLMLKNEVFSSLCLSMKLLRDDRIPAMATDGWAIYWNGAFAEKEGEDELMGVNAHEGLHKGLGHMLRRMGRDPDTWNIACDLTINHIVLDAGLKLPVDRIDVHSIHKHYGKLIPAKIINEMPKMNAERVYAYLDQARCKKPGDKPGQGQPQPGKGPSDLKAPDWGQVKEPSDLTEQNRAEKLQDAEAALHQAIEQAEARNPGSVPGSLKAMVKKMGEAKVDWKNVLQRFVHGAMPLDYSYRKPNKVYADAGIIMPTIEKFGVGELAIFVDTSGSVSDKDLEQFLGEMNAITSTCMPNRVIVVPCDSKVHEEYIVEYGMGENIEVFKAEGRGGTSFKPPFKWLEESGNVVDRIIYLTDLEGDFPEDPGVPTLWVTVRKGEAPFGEVVTISSDR